MKPLQCDRCGVYRAGDSGQIKKHLRDGDCERAGEFIPIQREDVLKGKALDRRSLSWEQIYRILFPKLNESDIPSPCKTTSLNQPPR